MVLHRPVELAALTGEVLAPKTPTSSNPVVCFLVERWALVPATRGVSLATLGCEKSVWQREAGPPVFTRFAETKSREQQCSPANHAPIEDCRGAHLRRYSLGATPISRLKTRLKELSDPYPAADATSKSEALFERLMTPPLSTRH